ncbi:MAG: DedA family protein [Actinomycetota bacterium]|nr:DedA family protein [Actinomycetota bacterium]
MIFASLSGHVTSFIGDHGLYAVFLLMLVDAVLPAASELVMLYAGALAAGAFSGQHVVLFGDRISSHLWGFFAISMAGVVGYTLGSLLGWAIGAYGGRPLLERRGRWLHLDRAKLDRADRWFERYGAAAVFWARVTPVVRSFISIPAGVVRMPIGRYTALTFLGTLPWCFGIAGAGWALGRSWERFHQDFRWAEYAVVVGVVALLVYLVLHTRSIRLARRADRSSR